MAAIPAKIWCVYLVYIHVYFICVMRHKWVYIQHEDQQATHKDPQRPTQLYMGAYVWYNPPPPTICDDGSLLIKETSVGIICVWLRIDWYKLD